jgi:hypothetical protein
LRVLNLRPRFHISKGRLAPRGTPEHDGVIDVLRNLADERVPLVGPGDHAVPHGPTLVGRAVPGTSLVICYIPAGDNVIVVDLLPSR